MFPFENQNRTTSYSIHMEHSPNPNPTNPTHRTEDERRQESLQILYQLKQHGITSKFPAIHTLIQELTRYVKEGVRIRLNIPFPELNKKIKGVLAVDKREECTVVMKHVG